MKKKSEESGTERIQQGLEWIWFASSFCPLHHLSLQKQVLLGLHGLFDDYFLYIYHRGVIVFSVASGVKCAGGIVHSQIAWVLD